MRKHANRSGASKTGAQTAVQRRTAYLRAAFSCLRAGNRTAAEALFVHAAIENRNVWRAQG